MSKAKFKVGDKVRINKETYYSATEHTRKTVFIVDSVESGGIVNLFMGGHDWFDDEIYWFREEHLDAVE